MWHTTLSQCNTTSRDLRPSPLPDLSINYARIAILMGPMLFTVDGSIFSDLVYWTGMLIKEGRSNSKQKFSQVMPRLPRIAEHLKCCEIWGYLVSKFQVTSCVHQKVIWNHKSHRKWIENVFHLFSVLCLLMAWCRSLIRHLRTQVWLILGPAHTRVHQQRS